MKTKIEDLIGMGHTKLGFFKEVQVKIGELQKSNLKLEGKRRQVQAILDGIADIVAVVAPDYRIRTINDSFYTVYETTEPLNDYCYKIFRQRDEPCPACPLREALQLNRVCRQNAIITINGRNRHFEITASPLRNSQGEPGDIILVKRDVTLEKEYQEQYYHAEKMATIGLLAAGVAHEINNPLAAIKGFAQGLQRRLPQLEQLVEDETLKKDYREYLEIIHKECRRCAEIVQSLLTFSPRKSLEFYRVDLNKLVENVMRLLHHRLKQLPPDIITLALAQDLPAIQGNPAELEQVILNLVLNALDAVEATTAGEIVLRTRSRDDAWVIVEVTDNGVGIETENMNKLFEPFFTTKPLGQGIGIGLSTCYHILQAHGGDITVDSAPGKGAVFTAKLPQYDHTKTTR
ncbi:MAG: ATP-binding protein [Desulfobacteraceae bacterium]|jgi:signal transduction histidine kinase